MPAWTLPRNSTCRQVREQIASAHKERTGFSGALFLRGRDAFADLSAWRMPLIIFRSVH